MYSSTDQPAVEEMLCESSFYSRFFQVGHNNVVTVVVVIVVVVVFIVVVVIVGGCLLSYHLFSYSYTNMVYWLLSWRMDS